MEHNLQRLQKYLARAGVSSRRKCEEIILSGRVSVNGSVIYELGTKVNPLTDTVQVDGETIALPDENSTCVILLNKPAGYLTAMADERETNLVSALVPVGEIPGLFPIGRLDKDTTGLLLFTNNGELGHALLHPSRSVDKRYVAEIEGKLSADDVNKLTNGIELEDGMTAPAKCEILQTSDTCQVVALTIHEGRKRQVRRMFAALNHPVRTLTRTNFGPIALGELPSGTWRELRAEEVSALKDACNL